MRLKVMKFMDSAAPQNDKQITGFHRTGMVLLSKLVVGVLLLAIVMGSAIAWRIDGRPGTPTLMPILLWQLVVWLPWLAYFFVVRRLVRSYNPYQEATPANIAAHVLAAVLISTSHLGWYWLVSDFGSPLKGLPDTRYGVYAFFFVFWFLIDLVLYLAVLAGQARHGQNPASASAEEEACDQQPLAGREEFVVRRGRARHVVRADDIRWIEAQGYYAELHTESGSYLIRQSLAKLENELDPERFIRVHRSTIVNVASVSSLRTGKNGAVNVVLSGGGQRRVSRSGYKSLKARLRPPG